MKVYYIAGPYRAPTVRGMVENIRAAEHVALKYWKRGHAVICPHLNTQLLDGSLPDKVWLQGDLELLKRCDVLVLMKGWQKSKGATGERELALQRNMKIIYE